MADFKNLVWKLIDGQTQILIHYEQGQPQKLSWYLIWWSF